MVNDLHLKRYCWDYFDTKSSKSRAGEFFWGLFFSHCGINPLSQKHVWDSEKGFVFYFARAALEASTTLAKVWGAFIAISANTFLSSSIVASFNPCINRE